LYLWKKKYVYTYFPLREKKGSAIITGLRIAGRKNTYIRISLREKKKEWNSGKQKYVYTYFPREKKKGWNSGKQKYVYTYFPREKKKDGRVMI
jgi:hypothetical protein